MTVLVTGGGGFLGTQLVRLLLLRGAHVTVLGRAGGSPVRERIQTLLAATGAGEVLADLGARLSNVTGDVAQPGLGLDDRTYSALAAEVDEIWHCAGSILLDSRAIRVTRTNATGTGHLLDFATATSPTTRLRHVSTAYVAGMRQGHVTEDDDLPNELRDFENPYEQSKAEAERLVLEWCNAQGRPALILRPSLLIPSLSNGAYVDGPEHTLNKIGRVLGQLGRRFAVGSGRVVVRVRTNPRARMNLLPVGSAARQMVAAAERCGDATSTVHIVHPEDVLVGTIAAAASDVYPVRMRIVPGTPQAPTPAEAVMYRRLDGFLRYVEHNRRYDTTRFDDLVPDAVRPPKLDRDYLSRCFVPAKAQSSKAV